MGTIAQKLTYLEDTKTAIGNAIAAKGGSVTGKTFRQYATEISNLPSGGGDDSMEHYLNNTLTSYTVPASVTSLHDYCFSHLTNLQSIDLNNVTSVGLYAFSNCSNLTVLNLRNVQTLGLSCFSVCTKIETINIPQTVTDLPNQAFTSCTNIKSVSLPSTLTSIGQQAFRNVFFLKTITIPSSVTSIGSLAFGSSKNIDNIIFEGTTPPSISTYASFTGNMCDISVPSAAVETYKTAFSTLANRIKSVTTSHDWSQTEMRYSNQTGTSSFTRISDTTLDTSNVTKTNLKDIFIGNNVTELSASLFNNFGESIHIDDNNIIETISDYALSRTNISDYVFENVVTIGESAFYYPKSPTSLTFTIGDKVTSIGQYAWQNINLTLIIKATTPPTLGQEALGYPVAIYVPAESVEAYKAATNWSTYADRIQAIPSE